MPKPATPASPHDSHLTVAFVSLGCPKNLVDSEKMLGLLAEDGIAITADHEQADAIVINTCGFLEASKTESLDVIREAIEAKTRAHGAKRVIVAGCLVQRHKAQLLDQVPEVDALVGVFDRENIVQAVRGGIENVADAGADLGSYHAVSSFISKPTRADIGKGYRESDRARLRLTPRHYAYLRVSEGCNQGCTFCTIPSIRGRMRSKPLPDILSEAEELLADGAVELNLIGQDTTSYGTDIGYAAAGEGLPGMLRSLDKLVSKKAAGSWVR
ncbi:MAG TPA: radical SAM protein, partial [Phycisphaerae bacterium]|nr:radical SAM protein [Phycisphaerae bacterium]